MQLIAVFNAFIAIVIAFQKKTSESQISKFKHNFEKLSERARQRKAWTTPTETWNNEDLSNAIIALHLLHCNVIFSFATTPIIGHQTEAIQTVESQSACCKVLKISSVHANYFLYNT